MDQPVEERAGGDDQGSARVTFSGLKFDPGDASVMGENARGLAEDPLDV